MRDESIHAMLDSPPTVEVDAERDVACQCTRLTVRFAVQDEDADRLDRNAFGTLIDGELMAAARTIMDQFDIYRAKRSDEHP